MQVNYSVNNGADHEKESYTMIAKEKRIIEELLVGCSPTLQRIVNAHNKFTIAPPSEERGNDEDASMAMASQLY